MDQNLIAARMRVLKSLGWHDVPLRPVRRRLAHFHYFLTRNEVDEIQDGTFNIWDYSDGEFSSPLNVATLEDVAAFASKLEAADPKALRS